MSNSKPLVILSLYEVHNASAALMVDGVVVAASHEERFSRLKGDHGIPVRAARFCLEQGGVDPLEVDHVVMLNERFDANGIANILFKRAALYSIDDWVFENREYWKPKLVDGKNLGSYFSLMGGWDRVPDNHYYDLKGFGMDGDPAAVSEAFNVLRRRAVEQHLGIPAGRVIFAPHHICHHYHAYYSGPFRGERTVVTHTEGDGGAYNCAVSIPTEQGLRIIGGSNQSNLGRLYQWTTLLLGMKPYHHEYKLMGLAPYASLPEVEKSYKVLSGLFRVDDDLMSVTHGQDKPPDLYWTFKNRLEGHRFDGIAGALQRVLEENLVEWMKMVIRKTGRTQVCFGGGVAMNVKANMLLAGIEGLENFYVPLSPADESNVMGAAYWLTEKHFLESGRDADSIPSLHSPYLGKEYGEDAVEAALSENSIAEKYRVFRGLPNSKLARGLAEGFVFSVSRGRSEFGQRALGNRSILAHPSTPGIVEKINGQIKYRDFWMPFCPSILAENADDYLENERGLVSDYMTIGFPVREDMRVRLRNVLHPGDGTARPQILRQSTNPQYFDLLRSFRDQTGLAVLLNTSFNLHGEPMVDSPQDAVSTFVRSNLDAVVVGDTVISRSADLDRLLDAGG